MRETYIVHSRLAWRRVRREAAEERRHGMLALSMELLGARLAGGFYQPVDLTTLKAAIIKAVLADLGELNCIKKLPGFPSAAATTLKRAWEAGLNFAENLTGADSSKQTRYEAFKLLEAEALKHLPPSMCRPFDLVNQAISRLDHAKDLFGRISVVGHTEMPPIWRRLLSGIAQFTDVRWIAGPRHVPAWLRDMKISVIGGPAERPEIECDSCASPRHEVVESFRWARSLIASGRARPDEIAIATAAPEEWDDHFLALSEMSGLDVHFVHGRRVLTAPEGQLCAALGEVLLRGFSHSRLVRLVALLRTQNTSFECVPPDWWRALPQNAPLLDAGRWREVLSNFDTSAIENSGDTTAALHQLVEALAQGLSQAANVGELVLSGPSRAIWRTVLTEGPPEAIDMTLSALRQQDDVPPESSIIWGPASSLAAEPRPYVRLIGLTSRAWPRKQQEDPLLPNHIVPLDLLDPLPVHEADRRDFDTVVKTTARQLICSYARRDAQGRINGISPLFPKDRSKGYLQRSRIAEHAAGWSDRFFARPAEFEGLPAAKSAISCWADWHRKELTPHDGLIRLDHPLIVTALSRRQSATSLSKLLRDPLGYLWKYGFHWDEPQQSEEPLTLDPLSFGKLLHTILEQAIRQLEQTHAGGFGLADEAAIIEAIDSAIPIVSADWSREFPVPPPVIWQRKLEEIHGLAVRALTFGEDSLPDQRSWAEIPFGADPEVDLLSEEVRKTLPWDPYKPVLIPGTTVTIGGSIDRLDISGCGTRARVTDYKSGKLPSKKVEPVLKGGAELQRCLYAYAVRSLLPGISEVAARLLYPRTENGGLYSLGEAESVLAKLADFVNAALQHLRAGNLLPGLGAKEESNDLAFALPGAAREGYLVLKGPLVANRLVDLSLLWEMD